MILLEPGYGNPDMGWKALFTQPPVEVDILNAIGNIVSAPSSG